jgi:hypothetical protein
MAFCTTNLLTNAVTTIYDQSVVVIVIVRAAEHFSFLFQEKSLKSFFSMAQLLFVVMQKKRCCNCEYAIVVFLLIAVR